VRPNSSRNGRQGANQSRSPKTQSSSYGRLRVDQNSEEWIQKANSGYQRGSSGKIAVHPLVVQSGCPTDQTTIKVFGPDMTCTSSPEERSDCSQNLPWTLRSVRIFQGSFDIAGIYHARSLKRQHWWWGTLPLTDRLLAPPCAEAQNIGIDCYVIAVDPDSNRAEAAGLRYTRAYQPVSRHSQ